MTDIKVKKRNKRNSQECKFIIELCLSPIFSKKIKSAIKTL